MSGIRKTYDLKQVKVTTSVLWILNKAETRNVFFSSLDIYLEKDLLQLHSLIIRGLVSGELYCAAITNMFPEIGDSKMKDMESVITFMTNKISSCQLNSSDSIVRDLIGPNGKFSELDYLSKLTNQTPFDLSEHLQLIDALMTICVYQSDLNALISTIVGKLCDYRPNCEDPKVLLQIWFKSICCLSMTQQNIKNMNEHMKDIIMNQENENSPLKKYFDNIKFSDKIAFILLYEKSSIEFEENFNFEYSNDGLSTRENIKHNFMNLLSIIRRKKLPKVLEDFKELMLILNSNHMQLTTNIFINIDIFVMEFFMCIENICNHANRTFRTSGSERKGKYTANIILKSTDSKKGAYSQTLNKISSNLNDQYSTLSQFGTYAARRTEQTSNKDSIMLMDWNNANTSANPINLRPKKNSLQLDLVSPEFRMANSEYSVQDGSLKSIYLTKQDQSNNKTSWTKQKENEKSKSNINNNDSNNNQSEKTRVNETRLRLNMKRKEIERGRYRLQEQKLREKQLLSEKIFREVMNTSSSKNTKNAKLMEQLDVEDDESDMSNSDIYMDEIETGSRSVKRVSDIKRKMTTGPQRQRNSSVSVTRSKSQDMSNLLKVDSINESIDQLKSQITKLTDEHAKLTARLDTPVVSNTETSIHTPLSTPHYSSLSTVTPTISTPGLPNYPTYAPVSELRQQRTYLYSHELSPPSGIKYLLHDNNTTQQITPSLSTTTTATTTNQQNSVPFKSEQNNDNIIEKENNPEQIQNEEVSSLKQELPPIPPQPPQESETVLDATTFFVQFDSESGSSSNGKIKKPIKKPKITDRTKKSQISNKTDDSNQNVISVKPVSFVVNLDEDNEKDAMDKSKLAQLAEKREQERLEKLGNIKESQRKETEKRLQMEQEKERIKLEKKAKRDAIFEAYKKRKEEQLEGKTEIHVSRRDTKNSKRNIRVLSAAPSIQRTNETKSTEMTASSITSNQRKPSISNLKNGSLSHQNDFKSPTTPNISTKLFVEPKVKSNKNVIQNALRDCCLAGKVNETLKIQSIDELERSSFSHHVILMRGGCQFRGLYGFDGESEALVKFSGVGPKRITSKMVDKFYKYNSGAKKFSEITSTNHISTVIDGITIYNMLWKSGNQHNSLHGNIPGSETSSQADISSQ